MVNGRYLDHSIDYRDVMGDILLDFLGNADLATLLPGHTYVPVGLLA